MLGDEAYAVPALDEGQAEAGGRGEVGPELRRSTERTRNV